MMTDSPNLKPGRPPAVVKAVEILGGIGALANRLGIKAPTIHQWHRVPTARVRAISDITQIPMHEIRPDVFRPPSGDVLAVQSGGSAVYSEALIENERLRNLLRDRTDSAVRRQVESLSLGFLIQVQGKTSKTLTEKAGNSVNAANMITMFMLSDILR